MFGQYLHEDPAAGGGKRSARPPVSLTNAANSCCLPRQEGKKLSVMRMTRSFGLSDFTSSVRRSPGFPCHVGSLILRVE
jgi:hypothetical protein